MDRASEGGMDLKQVLDDGRMTVLAGQEEGRCF